MHSGDVIFSIYLSYLIHSLNCRFAWSTLFTLLASSSLASLFGMKVASLASSYASKIAKLTISVSLALMAFDIRQRAIQVEADRSDEVFSFYMHIWNVFYRCYILLPLVKV